MTSTPEQRLQAHAACQHRLITRKQAYEVGYSLRQVAYRIRSGQWCQVRPGAFSIDGRKPDSYEAVVMSAVLAVPGSAAARGTALWLLGVTSLGKPTAIELSVPNGYRPMLKGVAFQQHRVLEACDVRAVNGIPTTTGERALVDLSPTLSTLDLYDVMDTAICDRIVKRATLHRRAKALHPGRAGLAALIAATEPGAAAAFASWLEAEAARTWAAGGLPAPRWNVPLRDARGRIGIIDAVFPPLDLVTVELDGLRFHRTPAQRRKDNERDRRLLLSGRMPLRYTYVDILVRPDEVIAEIRAALHQAAFRGQAVHVAGDSAR